MNTVLGVNHQFLFPTSMTDERAHTETLKTIASNDTIDALDCWVWRGVRAEEEIRILRDSGKAVNYNIGDRYGEKPCFPASPDKSERDRAYDLMMREISYALKVNSKKIVFASGPDMPEDHNAAIERFEELVLKVGNQLPKDVVLALEPTDWDIDKHFLFGKVSETTDFIHRIRKNGFERIGMLLDMCHIPIMHETLESALEKAEDTLVHIHLGNCVVKDPKNPYYGDKHVAWGYSAGEFSEEDGIRFLKLLQRKGYFEKSNTVSFEMRPIEGTPPEESLKRWISVWNRERKGKTK